MMIHMKVFGGSFEFSWVADSSLEGDNGKYCVGHAIFDIVDVVALHMAISAQPVELFALTWACILNRDKTGNAYTNSSILWEWLMMLGYCRSNMTSLLPEEEEKKKVC